MRCRVMGIVNVTPDSFSDGGRFYRPEEAVRRVRNLIAEGADIVDLGGESTRPGAVPIGWEEEWRRLEPVMAAVGTRERGSERGVRISVDTYHPETAARAIAFGADLINCVRAEAIPEMLKLLGGNGIELVLPSVLLTDPHPAFSVPRSFLPRLYLDPLIGFGTTRDEDLARLRSIPELAARGRVLVGASRKRIVKRLAGERVTGKDLGGNLALAVWAALQGASVVRVHDVRETVRALRVIGNLKYDII